MTDLYLIPPFEFINHLNKYSFVGNFELQKPTPSLFITTSGDALKAIPPFSDKCELSTLNQTLLNSRYRVYAGWCVWFGHNGTRIYDIAIFGIPDYDENSKLTMDLNTLLGKKKEICFCGRITHVKFYNEIDGFH